MEVRKVTVGPFMSNCYLSWSAETGVGFIVDPGDEPEKILEMVKKNQVKVDAIFLTHTHVDHVSATSALVPHFGCPVFAGAADIPLLEMLPVQTKAFSLPPVPIPSVDHELKDGARIKVGELEIEALHTPGHSPGHLCFLVVDGAERVMFTGDLISAGSIGRTDLWGGDMTSMVSSINRIKAIEQDVRILSGHGPETTLAREKRTNPYLNGMYL